MNYDHLLAEAKAEVVRMAEEGYRPPAVTGNIYAAGRDHLANLRIGVYMLREAGQISAHDAVIADHLAHILCGGELSQPAWMDEQYFPRPGAGGVPYTDRLFQEPGAHLAYVEEWEAAKELRLEIRGQRLV